MTNELRRDFLRLAGAGFASAAFYPVRAAQSADSEPTSGSLDVRSFGAEGDGKTLDTAAVNKAIDTSADAGGGTKEDATIAPPEKENEYPEPSMFGTMPAHGFYVRHLKGLEMSNIEIESLQPDARPAFVLNDVQEADFAGIQVPRWADVPVFSLNNVDRFDLRRCNVADDVRLNRVEQKKF